MAYHLNASFPCPSRRVLSALGGAFDYPAAKAELEQARRAAKALSRQQRRGGGRAAGVGAERYTLPLCCADELTRI